MECLCQAFYMDWLLFEINLIIRVNPLIFEKSPIHVECLLASISHGLVTFTQLFFRFFWKVTNPCRMLAHYIVRKHSTWIGDFSNSRILSKHSTQIGDFSSGQKLFQCFSTWIGDFSKSHQFEWNACAYFFIEYKFCFLAWVY